MIPFALRIAEVNLTAVKIMHFAHACAVGAPSTLRTGGQYTLVAAIPEEFPIIIKPRDRVAVPTGIALELPENWEGQIVPLQTLAMENGVTVLNSPGTIDPDYRGEIMVILINLGSISETIRRGDPIALIKFTPFQRVELVLAETLTETLRSGNGLGSTGV